MFNIIVYLRIKPNIMFQKIHTFQLGLSMELINKISKIDRFDAAWTLIEKREGQTLKQLKAIETVRSTGASTRIEGSKMTDEEVKVLIENLKISKLEERDQQEVVGYYETLDTITDSYKDIEITEGNVQNLHKMLMKYSEKDEWHRGDYKKVSNAVELNRLDGSKQIIFETTEPGLATQEAMKNLFEWYHLDRETLPIIKLALFVYDFLSIHPFQDGNGRLSRLLGTLLLLRHGYSWIQYVSFEHEIENRKTEYYNVLRETQSKRPNENVDNWIMFFLDCLSNIQEQLENKLNTNAHSMTVLAPREKNILVFIENHPGCKSSEIASKLNIPLPTVKKMLTNMVESKMILKYGNGAGTNYIAEKKSPLKTNLKFQLTNANKKKEFLLTTPSSFVEIKQVILTPLFIWSKPDEWSMKLGSQGLGFTIIVRNNRGNFFSRQNFLGGPPFNNEYYFKPEFKLIKPIHIPMELMNKNPLPNDFPIKIEIELFASTEKFDFDIMFVYDEV